MKKTVAELWEEIFADYNILFEISMNGYFIITADMIRKYKEPRLMAKFDFSKQLPKIFKDNNLGILPTKNGEYILGYFDLFQSIPVTQSRNMNALKVSLPSYIETIDPDNIYSESNALNVALLSGMINQVVGEDVVETIQGKMRTNSFDFLVEGTNGSTKIAVDKAAIEIDGGYEGKTKVALIEAKNCLPEDFVIRQLYYPYRLWSDKVLKEIIPIFFSYENGNYIFYTYKFNDLKEYNSLELTDIKKFTISNETSEMRKEYIFNNIELTDELSQKEVPFPQADSITRIIGLIEMIDDDVNDALSVSEQFDFEPRQGSYYIAAAKYLGYVADGNTKGKYVLSVFGKMLNELDVKTRNEKIIESILKHKPFYYTYKYYLENKMLPSKEYIVDLINKYTGIENDEVLKRRASTVRGWIEWIIGAQI